MRMMLALLLVSACGDFSEADRGFGDNGAAAENDEDLGLDSTDDENGSRPAYWSLDGSLSVDPDGLITAETLIEIRYFDTSGRPWPEPDDSPIESESDSVDTHEGTDAEPDLGCVFTIGEVEPGPERDHELAPLLLWATVDLDLAEGASCPWSFPTPPSLDRGEGPRAVLGLGPLPSVMRGPMQAAGMEPELPLFGLSTIYTTASGERATTFGVGGSEEQFNGVEPDLDTYELPEGVYQLHALVLVPLP